MAKILLDKLSLDALHCPENLAKSSIFDKGCRGLMLELRPTGRKTFYLRYTDDRGIQRQYKLGDARDMTLESARRQADRLRGRILEGHNPALAREQRRRTPTLEDFVKNLYMPYIKSYKRSWETDDSLLRNHLLPRFGLQHMDAIRKHEVQDFITSVSQKHKPATVNRFLIVLRFVFNQAIRWETPGVTINPTQGIRMLKENNKKERFLSPDEAHLLYQAVCESTNPMLRYIIPMLILTGARKREVLDAQWTDFDLSRRLWRIPMSKSGFSRYVPLSDGAVSLLSSIPRSTSVPFVFANPSTGHPFTNIFNAWNTARMKAHLLDVRIHDLRHSFASLLVNEGRSLYEVQKILGHSQIKTTQRYAHLNNHTLVDAANAASRAMAVALGGVSQTEPIE